MLLLAKTCEIRWKRFSVCSKHIICLQCFYEWLKCSPLALTHADTTAVCTCMMVWSSVNKQLWILCTLLCCRSQWSSGNMSDCSARGPGIESRCGQLCLSHNHCDLQPWAQAVCTLPAVPRSTQPSTLCGTVNEYQLSGWVIIINGDGGCRR